MTSENKTTDTPLIPPTPKPLPQTYTVTLGEMEKMLKMLSSGYKALIAGATCDEKQALIEERRARLKDLSKRAAKISAAVPDVGLKPAQSLHASLIEQARLLDALFRQILTDTTQGGDFTESGGINAALRAQNQYLRTLQTIDKPLDRPHMRREKMRTDY